MKNKQVKFGNEHLPTPLKWRRIGKVFLSISSFIAGYGLTMDVEWLGYTGLFLGLLGTVITDLFYE